MLDTNLLSSQDVRAALQAKSINHLRRLFRNLESADIAASMVELNADECIAAMRFVEKARKADVFSCLPRELQISTLTTMPDDAASFIANEMEPVDRTQLFEELSPDLSNKLLLRLDPNESRMARKLLGYPHESVGRLMNPEFFSLRAGITVVAAIDYIRWNATRYTEEALSQIFVVGEDGRYLGDVRLAALFVADDTTMPVENLIGASYVTLSAEKPETAAVDMFRKYEKSSIPVIDKNGVLVGVVTADDVFDVAEEEASEDLQQFGGAGALEDSYLATDMVTLLRKRAGWLFVLFLGGLCSGQAVGQFQSIIAKYGFLVIFLPLIVASGGNSGSQAASLIIRGLAIREFNLGQWFQIFRREVVVGICLGSMLAVLGFLSSLLWGFAATQALVIAFALLSVVILGTLLGSMLPFILARMGVDPAVSSSPLIASLADLFGILIFFGIAVAML